MVLLFNRWDTNNIKVEDEGLKEYITLKPIIVPKTGGKNAKIRFHKNKYHIVERLINKLMVPGHRGKKHKLTSGKCTGKAIRAYEIVKNSFILIEKKINTNPVEVFIKALENSAPREEITSIEYGGARYSQAVDCSPQRRIDVALRMFVQGAYAQTFKKKKRACEFLADEILKAYNLDQKSVAIHKKLELERQADASR